MDPGPVGSSALAAPKGSTNFTSPETLRGIYNYSEPGQSRYCRRTNKDVTITNRFDRPTIIHASTDKVRLGTERIIYYLAMDRNTCTAWHVNAGRNLLITHARAHINTNKIRIN